MKRWQQFNSIELQHVVAALARSPLSHHEITQALTDQAADELDRKLENSLAASTTRYNAGAAA